MHVPKAPLLFSQRWILIVLALLGNMFIYVTRVNLSVAILCMVKSDNVTQTNLTSFTKVAADDNGCGGDLGVTSEQTNNRGEFTWDKGTRSTLLSMYFYGYVFTQIPGGWMASRYGGKRVWGTCMLICALCTLATPISARTNIYLTYVIRFILGFASGVTFPCVHALLGRWTPPYERSKMASYTFSGPQLGNIITFAVSGILCEYGFDSGWPSIFYLGGIFTLIWVILWFLFVSDSPEKHKHIKKKELDYIKYSIGKGNVEKVRKIPWVAMMRSGPLWAVIIGHMGSNYLNYTMVTSLPTFMKESLKFDIKQNGILSSLPFVSQLVFSAMVGYLADTVREKRWLSTKSVRKICQCTGFFGVAVCGIIVGQLECSQRYVAVAMLCLCMFFQSFNRAGYAVNHLDLAPSYAGILFGITNTAATIPGIISPIVAGALTPNRTPEEWRNVFYVCAGVSALAGILYMWLADGELQMWANPEFFKNIDKEMTYQQVSKDRDDDMQTAIAVDAAQIDAVHQHGKEH